MSDKAIAKKMIREKPRDWNEIITHFASQPYRSIYRAFGQLLLKLGRVADQRANYPYTFSDTDFADMPKKPKA